MSRLDILIPFALPPAQIAADLLKELNTPALAILSARSRPERGGTSHQSIDAFARALPHETWLARQFAVENAAHTSPAIAAALMRSYGLKVDAGTWFVLQPVHIHIARDHLVLTDPRQLTLAEQEARALFSIAQELFAETGRSLLYGSADTWFVRADDWIELQTSTPDAAAGHNIDIWMPQGAGERDWRKVQNEVQMHWFDHPVNAAREAQGLKPVNSIWLWGGAAAIAKPAPNRYTDTINLAGWIQAFAQFVPRNTRAGSAAQLAAARPEHGLVLLDELLEPALSSDWSHWLDQVRKLETDWFAPLRAALTAGTIDAVQFILTNDSRISRFTTTRFSLRKFWVKPSLATLCP